ncbi:MAG: histidine triad nucleotide-binding protein [Coriobacteriia bacterium]|nr:histidine triad nucleotide-binding protein [Coriobacteriia bacterium]MCL2537581.1 histidine triad nucleotide-binding protein [Coriobacteriia bacterium]
MTGITQDARTELNAQDDCIFCKIIAGDFGTEFVYEDEYVVAFDDLHPQKPVHTLIVPRYHVENLEDHPDPQLLGQIFSAIPKVAAIKGVNESGYRVIQNNGAGAGQTVFHLHVHLLGGGSFTEGMV